MQMAVQFVVNSSIINQPEIRLFYRFALHKIHIAWCGTEVKVEKNIVGVVIHLCVFRSV